MRDKVELEALELNLQLQKLLKNRHEENQSDGEVAAINDEIKQVQHTYDTLKRLLK